MFLTAGKALSLKLIHKFCTPCINDGCRKLFRLPKSKSQMKAILWLLLLALAVNVPAAEMTKTNSPAEETNAPAAKKSELATIPDATHQPVFTTNTVTIAGKHVTYMAETGMLPILKPDGTSRASVFYVAYTRVGIEVGNVGRRGRSRFVSMAVRVLLPCGCIWARSVRAA